MVFDDLEFDWDEGNIHKVQLRFQLTEVESFFNQDLYLTPDTLHSASEARMIAIGLGPGGKNMMVCFTIRNAKLRVISARYMKFKEVSKYEKAKKI